ncbi:MAG: hypothetical protein CMO01_14745 [Thalassobius sp.]|nr:hypothetical protein [Thalassovita sp.]
MKTKFLIFSLIAGTTLFFTNCSTSSSERSAESAYEETSADFQHRKEALAFNIQRKIDQIDEEIEINERKMEEASENIKDETKENYKEAKGELMEFRKELSADLNDIQNSTEDNFDELERDFEVTTAKIDNELDEFGKEVRNLFDS